MRNLINEALLYEVRFHLHEDEIHRLETELNGETGTYIALHRYFIDTEVYPLSDTERDKAIFLTMLYSHNLNYFQSQQRYVH